MFSEGCIAAIEDISLVTYSSRCVNYEVFDFFFVFWYDKSG